MIQLGFHVIRGIGQVPWVLINFLNAYLLALKVGGTNCNKYGPLRSFLSHIFWVLEQFRKNSNEYDSMSTASLQHLLRL